MAGQEHLLLEFGHEIDGQQSIKCFFDSSGNPNNVRQPELRFEVGSDGKTRVYGGEYTTGGPR